MTPRSKKHRHRKVPAKRDKRFAIVEYPMTNPIPRELITRHHQLIGRETPAALFKFEPPDPEREWALLNGLAYFSLPKFFKDTQDCGLAINCDLSAEDLREALSIDNEWLTASTPWELGISSSNANFNTEFNPSFSITYFRSIREEFKRGGLPRVRKMLRVLANAFMEPVKTGGIYCVTEDWHNEFMWENYARAGSGFVLEFDTMTCPVCWDASPVKYVDAFPDVKLHASAMSGTVMQDMLRVPLTKLRNPWEGEREWRIWRRAPGFYRYPVSSLISVTFGPNVDQEFLLDIFAYFRAKDLSRVQFYRTEYSEGQLVRIPI